MHAVRSLRFWNDTGSSRHRSGAGRRHRLGVALHDLLNPAQLLGICDSWILQPEDPWEITGYVHNVVFTCGAVAEANGTVKIYWGGADTVMCVGEANLADLVDLCLDQNRLPNPIALESGRPAGAERREV